MVIEENLRNNKQAVIDAVSKDGFSLEYASDELKHDREVVMAAVKNNGQSLKYASDELKNDEEIVLTALLNDINVPYVYSLAGDELKNNKGVFLLANLILPIDLEKTGEKIKNDKNFISSVRSRKIYENLPVLSEITKNFILSNATKGAFFAVKLSDLYKLNVGDDMDLNYEQSLKTSNADERMTMLVGMGKGIFRECFTGKCVRLVDNNLSNAKREKTEIVDLCKNMMETPLFCSNVILLDQQTKPIIGKTFLQNKAIEKEMTELINELFKDAERNLNKVIIQDDYYNGEEQSYLIDMMRNLNSMPPTSNNNKIVTEVDLSRYRR